MAPNRPASVLITIVGSFLFFAAALDLLPLNRYVWFLCLFFGLIMLAGGVVLLLYELDLPNRAEPPDAESILTQTQYEEALKLVLSEQAKSGIDNESALQRGVDFLVAIGVSPKKAKENLHTVLSSFLEQDQNQKD